MTRSCAARRADAADRRQKPQRTPGPRRRLDRRLRLGPRRKLARGAARSHDAARRHPFVAGGGERLCRSRAGADPSAAAPTRARDARPVERGRRRGSPNRRPLRLLFAVPPRRPAPHLSAASRAAGARRRSLSTATRSPSARGFPSGARPLVARPLPGSPGAPTTRARKCTRSGCATSRGEADLADCLENTTGEAVWTADSGGFLYVEQDEDHRPWRVMLHRLGTPQGEDVQIFEEADPAFFIAIRATRLGRWR